VSYTASASHSNHHDVLPCHKLQINEAEDYELKSLKADLKACFVENNNPSFGPMQVSDG
jgi:hypothetical protein